MAPKVFLCRLHLEMYFLSGVEFFFEYNSKICFFCVLGIDLDSFPLTSYLTREVNDAGSYV